MPTASDSLWADILGYIRMYHNSLARSWFDELEPEELDHGVLRIRVANHAQQRYLSDHCARAFAEGAQAATGRLVTVRFSAPGDGPGYSPELHVLSFDRSSELLSLNPDYTFEQFVTGPCNRLAHATCVAVSDAPGRAYNPLFLHGNVGLGKTHLLQASCHRIVERDPVSRILFLSCESFINHFLEAVEHGAMHDFRYRYRHVDMLVIDDVQFLAERERSQEEFFHTFNTLYQAQKQIILSADSLPKDIPSLEDRLISRFNWGLVVRIDQPALETRMAILRKKAKLRCIDLPEEVMHLIASRIASNTRELEGAILKVDALSRQGSSPINAALAEQALADHPPAEPAQTTIPDIVETVTKRYNVRASDLRGKKRNRSIALPRQVCMYLAREMTPLSLQEIGGYFGGRDHSTVLHASRCISSLRRADKQLDQVLNELTQALQQALH